MRCGALIPLPPLGDVTGQGSHVQMHTLLIRMPKEVVQIFEVVIAVRIFLWTSPIITWRMFPFIYSTVDSEADTYAESAMHVQSPSARCLVEGSG